MSDPEWDATVFMLEHVDAMCPCGLRPGGVLAHVHPDRRSIDWSGLLDIFAVASSGEHLLLDVALALWTSSSKTEREDKPGDRPLAPLAAIWLNLSDRHVVAVIEALRIRSGLVVTS